MGAAHEVVDHVWEVKKEGDWIDEEYGSDHGRYRWIVQQVSGNDSAVGLADEYEIIPFVLLQYLQNLMAHFVFGQSGVSHAEADWEDFEGYEADLTIGGVSGVRRGGEFLYKLDVGLQTNSNTVDE